MTTDTLFSIRIFENYIQLFVCFITDTSLEALPTPNQFLNLECTTLNVEKILSTLADDDLTVVSMLINFIFFNYIPHFKFYKTTRNQILF